MTTFSQSDLYVPCLRALNENPGAQLGSPELLDAICRVLAVQPDCMGAKDGRPALLTPMGNAVWQLKDRGLINSPRRGLHQITAAGIAWLANGGGTLPAKVASVAPAPVAPPAPVAVTEPVAPPAPAEPPAPPESVEAIAERLAEAEDAPPATKPATKRSKTAKLAVVPADDAPVWVKDNYLRGLVAAQTPCFGQYSPTAAACGGCALAPWCRNAQSAALSVLASKLIEGERVSAATAKLHTETAAALSPSAPRATVTNPPRRIPVQYDGVCARTGAPLTVGSVGYYVPGEGVCSEGSLTSEERASITEWGKP